MWFNHKTVNVLKTVRKRMIQQYAMYIGILLGLLTSPIHNDSVSDEESLFTHYNTLTESNPNSINEIRTMTLQLLNPNGRLE
jgi:hypothetical protein